MAVKDEKLSNAIAEAIKALDTELIVFAPPNSSLSEAAAKSGLRVAHEFFADRAYNSDGSLVSRKHSNAIIQNPKKVVERVVKAVEDGTVAASNGEVLDVGKVHTVCVHGDTPTALELAEAIKKGLMRADIEVKPVGSFI